MDNNVIAIFGAILGSVASGLVIYLFKSFNVIQIKVAKLESHIENIEKQNDKIGDSLEKMEIEIKQVYGLIQEINLNLASIKGSIKN